MEQGDGKLKDAGDAQEAFGFRGSQPAGNLAASQGAGRDSDEVREFVDGNAAFGGKEFKSAKRKPPAELADEMGGRGYSQTEAGAGGSIPGRAARG
jgi:hypothetical protein